MPQEAQEISEIRGLSPLKQGFRQVLHEPTGLIGLILVVLVLLVALLCGLLAPFDPYEPDLVNARKPPLTSGHFFGTDHLGRDILSRTLYGARISLRVGALSCLIASAIGIFLGTLAGYFGGLVDTLIMRIVDILLAFPFLILAIAVMAVFQEPSLTLVFVVLGIVGWAGISRLIRSQVLYTKELDFVQAARALGSSHLRIMLLHVLPNCIGPAIIWFTMAIAAFMMAEASLSFLGLGAEPGTPSWGAMINDGFAYFTTDWWITVFPGLALAVAVLGFNLLGDSLQDALNPKLKK